MKFWALIAVLLVSPILVFANEAKDLQHQKDKAQQQRLELNARIAKIQEGIDLQLKQRKTADAKLKDTESAISAISRELYDLEQQQSQIKTEIKALEQQQSQAQESLKQQQDQLSKQLLAQYQDQLSAWEVLLSGQDPNEIGRQLAYIEYIHKSQSTVIEQVSEFINELQQIKAQTNDKQNALQKVILSTNSNKDLLQKQQTQHAKILKNIDAELRKNRTQTKVLEEDQNKLGQLIANLQVEIDLQAQKIKQEQQLEQQKQQEQIQTVKKTSSAPAGAMLGLEKNLNKPVKGEVLGRFGADRPEGGVWRGIVIRSALGTQVKSVASGQIVYANWLAGFGNILIIDHGEQFLSVYAYNHSLLKQIGDKVAVNDVIATVGATGGQVEPGLYFEIRKNGKPVNPILWLRQ